MRDKHRIIYSDNLDTMKQWYPIGQYRTVPLEPLPIPVEPPKKLNQIASTTNSPPDAVYTRLYKSLPAHSRTPAQKVQPQTYPMGRRWRT